MKVHGDKFIFESTGIEQYANCGIVGINVALEVTGGYDDSCVRTVWQEDKEDYRELNTDERTELADYMIMLWKRYKAEPTDGDSKNG